jgi:hypothetical protein
VRVLDKRSSSTEIRAMPLTERIKDLKFLRKFTSSIVYFFWEVSVGFKKSEKFGRSSLKIRSSVSEERCV